MIAFWIILGAYVVIAFVVLREIDFLNECESYRDPWTCQRDEIRELLEVPEPREDVA